MKLLKNLEIIRNALHITNTNTLIISDLHIGQDESMNKNGFLIPRFQYQDLLKETQLLIKKTNPKTIIINGDIKHEFKDISQEEWKKVREYLNHLKRKSNIKIIKGNHDSIIEHITKNLNIETSTYELINDFFICHGDKIIENNDFKKSKTIIIGHEHPAITLTEGVRSEKYKCFIVGTYKKKTLIVMPAMNPSSEGSDILKEKPLSPFLKKNKNLKNFETYITEENKTYHFGKIKNLK